MASSIQVTHTNETTTTDDSNPELTILFGGKTESGLVRFIIKSIFFIAIIVWSQNENLNQDFFSTTSNYTTSNIAVNLTSIFSSVKPELTTHSVYSTIQKNCIGSNDGPVRFNPKSKSLKGILKPIVKVEVSDEFIHPENYTPNTSKAIQREAVHQRSDTFFNEKKTDFDVNKNEPFGSVVYTVSHFQEMESYSATFASINSSTKTNISPRKVAHRLSKPAVRPSQNKETVRAAIPLKKGSESTKISSFKIASLQLSNIAAPENAAPINSSDNASTTKQVNKQFNNLNVDESEANASVSLTQELLARPEVTSSQFNELRLSAFENDKMMLVRFTASWCVPCKVMEENVYANPQIKAYMDQHFVAMKLDVDSFDGINLKQIYDVQLIPSFLVFKSNGDLAGHFKKAISSQEMLNLLKDQVRELNNTDGTNSLSKSENDNEDLEIDRNTIAR